MQMLRRSHLGVAETTTESICFSYWGESSMRNAIEKRLIELERRFHRAEITLIMPDGSRQAILLGPGESGFDLFQRVMREPDSPTADAVRKSVSAKEPGGSRFCEVICALAGPADTAHESDHKREGETYVH
jgi:hypothetical protein